MPSFEELLDQMASQEAGTTVLSPDGNPDEAAKAAAMAPQVGLPASVIRLDTTGFERRLEAMKNAETVRQDPALQNYVNRSPINAEASKDDFDQLSVLSKIWTSVGPRGYTAGRIEERAGLAAGLEYFGLPAAGLDPDVLERRASELNAPLPWPYRALQVAAGGVGGMAEDVVAGGAIGAGAGAFGGPVGAGLGLAAGSGAAAYLAAAGRKNRELAAEEERTGQQVDPLMRRAAILSSATSAFVLETLGVRGPMKAGIDEIIGEATRRAAADPTFVRSAARVSSEVAKSGLQGSALFGLQAGIEGVITDLAKTGSEGDWATIFNDPNRREEFTGQVYKTMVEGAAAMGALRVPSAGASFISDMAYIRQARQNANTHDQMMSGAVASKTRERNTQVFRDFVQEVVGKRSIGIDVEALAESGQVEAVRAIVPDFDRQAEVALSTGGTINVPYADYIARIDPQVDAALREGIVWEPGGLSLREAAGLEAWHGTPHTFDAFQFNEKTFKSGEGAAALADYGQPEVTYEKPAAGPVTFKTAKGSSYVVNPDGTTTRNKAFRPEHGEKEQGPQPQSERTFYVTPEDAQKLGEFQTQGSAKAVGQTGPNTWAVKYLDGASAGKFEKRTNVTVQEAPAVGLIPVEIWKDGTRVHFGNEIIELSTAPTELRGTVGPTPVIEPALADPNGARAAEAVQVIAEDTAKELWLQPLFLGKSFPGMTAMETRRYSQRLEEWTNGVNEAALKAARREVSRRQTADWKQTSDRFRDEVTREVNLQPDFRAHEFLTKGKLIGEDIPVPAEARVRLSRAAVADITGDPLPKGTTAKDGIDPDEVAPLFGYRTGEELVRALAAMERDRAGRPLEQYRKDIIEGEVLQRTEEVHGRLDENIEREAQQTALELTQQDLLATDLAILGKQIDAPPFEVDTTRARMQELFNDMPMGQARELRDFTRLVGKAGRNAELALLKGDIAKAFEQKQIQLMAHMMRVEAQKFSREVERAEKRFKRLGKKAVGREKDKGIGSAQRYYDQIHGLLARHGYKVRRRVDELSKTMDQTPLADFVQQNRDMEGGTVAVSRNLFGKEVVDTEAKSANYFRELAEAVKSLEHNALEENQITIAGEKVRLDEVADRLVESAEKLPGRYGSGWSAWLSGTMEDSRGLRWAMHTGDSWLMQTKRFFDRLDEFDPAGQWNMTVMRRLREADGEAKLYRMELAEQAKGTKVPKSLNRAWSQNIFMTNLQRGGQTPMEMTRHDLVMIAANLGSQENTQKLINTHFPETKDNVQLYIDRRNQLLDTVQRDMTPEEWAYVQNLWSFFEKMWPRIEKVTRQRFGVSRAKKTNSPIDIGNGQRVEGGYIPIFYDPIRGQQKGRSAATFAGNYHGVETWHGFLEEVSEGTPGGRVMQVKGSHQLLNHRIMQMAHDLTMHDAIVDVQKILEHPKVKTALQQTLGLEAHRQFHPWLQAIANRFVHNEGGLSRLAEMSQGFRGRVTAALLSLNPMVVLTPSMGNVARSLKNMSTHPIDTFRALWFDEDMQSFALKNSPTLQTWLSEGYNRDIDDMISRQARRHKVRDAVVRWGFLAVTPIERRLAYLAWATEFVDAKNKGLSEGDAIAVAEKRLNDDFPRQGALDLAPIMNQANEGIKQLTLMHGFFSFLYNRVRSSGAQLNTAQRQARRSDWKGARRNFAGALSDFTSFFILNAVIGATVESLMGREPWEEDDDWGTAIAKVSGGMLGSSVPLVRDVYRRFVEGDKRGISHPVIIMGDYIAKGAKVGIDAAKGEEVSDKWIADLWGAVAMPMGVPTQIGKSAQFIYDYSEGEQRPEDFGEWMRGIFTGKAEKE